MSQRWSRITCVVGMVTLLAMPAAGQTDKLPVRSLDDLKAAIDPATIVEVTTTAQYVIGTLSDATGTRIHIRALDGNLYAFDRATVERIVEKDSTRDGTIAGAIIGAIPGLVGGLIINKICYNEVGSCPGAVVGLTALGAGIGAGIGFAADNGREKLVYDRQLASAAPALLFRAALRWR